MTLLKHDPRPWSDEDRAEPLSGLRLPSTDLPVMRLGRELTGDLAALEDREWLVTNGIGGYAVRQPVGRC